MNITPTLYSVQNACDVTKELIQQYNTQLNTSAIVLIGIVFVMWLLEPILRGKVKDDDPWKDYYLFIYKATGLGLLALSVLSMLVASGAL